MISSQQERPYLAFLALFGSNEYQTTPLVKILGQLMELSGSLPYIMDPINIVYFNK